MSETETQGLSSEIPASGVFDPPAGLAGQANVTQADYDRATEDRLGFWADAAQRLEWSKPWDEVLDWTNPPFAQWFVGGELNVAVNCVDRHVAAGNGEKVAYHWVGEPGDTRTITYAQLKDEVSKTANALTALGVQPGDRVAVYLPMIPEAVITMLACARIGAVHMVVFGGFSPDALASRIEDAGAKVVVTADGGFRRGAPSALKPAVDEALTKVSGVEHVLVVKRTEQDVDWTDGRDQWWHDLVDSQSTEHEAQPFDAEHPLYIMYTSGTTAKPKGILHTSGGYLTQVSWTHWATFDLKADTDVFWCAADVAWVTGHSYIVYGPLSNGATSVMYEGTPETPHRGRWWEIVQEYGVSILYAAPTVVRTFMKWGADVLEPFDLSTLRVLGSVGEPINPEAWLWYRKNVGGGTATVVDTWWQTETGAHMIAPMPGVTATKPGSAQVAVPGIAIDVVDEM
ncbi:MAG: Acetyl-coenzyme synthetase, partial [Klenkia sp.]|nr:Acetyl-coenzyme synthetase [Klenkia sp.]